MTTITLETVDGEMPGRKFARWLVLSPVPRRGRWHDHWLCRCECGTEREVSGPSLRTGHTRSCGCLVKDRREELTPERARKLLDYNPLTGEFTWKAWRGGPAVAGSKAGIVRKQDGRIYIRICGRRVMASRLAWFWMTGEWPADEIDHKDTNPSNDAWDNLREATRSQNGGNCSLSKANTTGFKGVTFDKTNRRFMAQISVKRRQIHLGSFKTATEAAQAYALAAKSYFGDFARIN